MQLEILSLCDAATDYAGKLNLLGATDTIFAPKLPFKYPHCAIVMRFRVARIEEGEHVVKLMIIDMDGGVIMDVNCQMNIRLNSGISSAVNLIMNVNNLELKEAGEFSIEVAVDGIQMSSSPLFVRLAKQPQSIQQNTETKEE